MSELQQVLIEKYDIRQKPSLSGFAKGTPNPQNMTDKVFSTAREIAAWVGVDPFEVLLHFAGGNFAELGYSPEDISPGLRFRAAAEAVKYLHPTVKAIALFDGGDDARAEKQRMVDHLMDALDDEASTIAASVSA